MGAGESLVVGRGLVAAATPILESDEDKGNEAADNGYQCLCAEHQIGKRTGFHHVDRRDKTFQAENDGKLVRPEAAVGRYAHRDA